MTAGGASPILPALRVARLSGVAVLAGGFAFLADLLLLVWIGRIKTDFASGLTGEPEMLGAMVLMAGARSC